MEEAIFCNATECDDPEGVSRCQEKMNVSGKMNICKCIAEIMYYRRSPYINAAIYFDTSTRVDHSLQLNSWPNG